MNSFKSSKLIHYLFALAPAWTVLLLLRLNTPLYIGDDAYMTFKVARNLLNGHGFVYNIGEYVLVTTTPLWTSLLASISWLFNTQPEDVFRPILLLLDLFNCFIILQLASVSGKFLARGSVACLLFALSWHMTFASLVGMEPSLFVALMGSSLALQANAQTRFVSGLLAGLAFMTRPEGALFLLAIGIVRLIRDKKIPWPEVLAGSLVVLPYLAWLYYYFGSILPHAGVAKSIAYYRTEFQAFVALSDHIVMLTLTPWFDKTSLFANCLPYFIWMVWLYGVYLAAKHSIGILIAGVGTFFVLCLYTIANPLLFEWYVVPLELSYVISLVWGFCGLAKKASKFFWQDFYQHAVASAVVIMFGFGVFRYQLPKLQVDIKPGPGGYRGWPSLIEPSLSNESMKLPVLGPVRREELYIELAQLIEPDVNPQTVVIAPEYGAFGYHTSAKMLSSIGHTSKEMFKYIPVPREQVGEHINNSISQEMIDAFKPDYVLSLETFIRKSLLLSDKFQQEYELVRKLDSQVFNSRGLYLFKRKQVQGLLEHDVENADND